MTDDGQSAAATALVSFGGKRSAAGLADPEAKRVQTSAGAKAALLTVRVKFVDHVAREKTIPVSPGTCVLYLKEQIDKKNEKSHWHCMMLLHVESAKTLNDGDTITSDCTVLVCLQPNTGNYSWVPVPLQRYLAPSRSFFQGEGTIPAIFKDKGTIPANWESPGGASFQLPPFESREDTVVQKLQDGNENEILRVKGVMLPSSGTHTITMTCRYNDGVSCGADYYEMDHPIRIGVTGVTQHGRKGWFLDTIWGGIHGTGGVQSVNVDEINYGSACFVSDSEPTFTMQLDTNEHTLRFWKNGELHNVSCANVQGKLQWAVIAPTAGSTVVIQKRPPHLKGTMQTLDELKSY